MAKKIKVIMKRERRYDVDEGGKFIVFMLLRFWKNSTVKNFAVPFMANERVPFKRGCWLRDFHRDLTLQKKMVEKAVKRFIENRKVICKSCMQGLSG